LKPNGKQTKEWFDDYSAAEVLTLGQKDIIENWMIYRDRFLKEMNL